MVNLVHHQQGTVAPELGEMQVWRRRHSLVGGDVARQPAAWIGGIVGRPHRQRMRQGRAPGRIGERLLGLQPQAVARHHPAHPLHQAGGDQPGGRDHRQQRFAATRRHSGQDVAHLRLTAHNGGGDLVEETLVRAKRTGQQRTNPGT